MTAIRIVLLVLSVVVGFVGYEAIFDKSLTDNERKFAGIFAALGVIMVATINFKIM